jgi:hypothetical protein
VTLNDGPNLRVEIETPVGTDEDKMWLYLCTRVAVDPKQDPNAFLHALPDAIDSTYVIATSVHDDSECPYVHEEDTGPLR